MNWKTIFRLKTVYSILFFSLLAHNLQAQERTCGMVEVMEERMKDPEYARQYKKAQDAFKIKFAERLNINTSSKQMMDPIIIPVAVHFPSGLESDRACLEALAQNQIDILNADFTGTNADIADWTNAAPFYPGTNTGAANILFCIATTNHPTGVDPEMVEGGPAVTIGYNYGNGGETDATWGGYMNFLVKNLGAETLGFSPLGGSIANGDSVTMNLGAFGSGAGCPNSGIIPGAPYNLGRTVTHELGHFYNLNHTFSGSCTNDDGITDTPNQNQPSGGCPTVGNNPACNAGEQVLFQNFMDYTDDACMIMFSAGQIAVAEAYISSIQNTFKPNVTTCNAPSNFILASTNNELSICSSDNSAVYNLTFTTVSGYSDNTTLSASGLPSGATATFSPTTISADGNITLTISNLSVAGNYTITITGTGSVTNTLDVNLNIFGNTPNVPATSAPANNATDTPTSVDLVWNATSDTENYIVELATDMAFTNIIATSTQPETSFTTPELTEMTDYYWRVKSTNGCGDSVYSTTNKFTTASITCSTVDSTENNVSIPSTGTTEHVITSTLNVTEDLNITDLNVTVNIQHTWAGDIEIKLTSPNGTEVILNANSTCDTGVDDIFAVFDDQAAGPVNCNATSPAIGGTIQPANALSAFNGESSLGNWIMTITDGFPAEDGGTLQNFSLEICGASSLSTDEFNLANTLSLWPNPSNGSINLSLETNNNDNVNVSLFDIRGRLISKQSLSNSGRLNKTLTYSNLENAMYIISIENRGQTINKRIIINK